MSGIKDQQNIEEMRKRLYQRDFVAGEQTTRSKLSETNFDVSRGWNTNRPSLVTNPATTTPTNLASAGNIDIVPTSEETPKKKYSYRMIIVLASIFVFVLTVAVSSVYLFFGANQISAKNINLSIDVPFAIAAGEKLTMQVNVANQNSVAVEAATLIINYPTGTKTADAETRELYESRIPIDTIDPGEAINIPVMAVLFGEENDEKEIKVSVEYRVVGSNGTFFKELDPVKIKINSSPLVIRVNSVEKVSSGQEIEVKITVQSNAQTVQKNVLIAASYPTSFSFLKSDPEPFYGQNEWLLAEIPPESSQVITLRGRVNGFANEQAEIQFSAGTPRTDNQFIMGSVLTKTKTNYVIEHPFIDVRVVINQDTDGEAVINSGTEAAVTVLVTNTLEETIYDMRVEVLPKGNLIRDSLLNVPSGFYDTNSKTIRYEVSGMRNLAEVRPGETREFLFSVKPDTNQVTASFDISTNVFARRVSEASAAEEMVGTTVASAKYSSEVTARSQAGYGSGAFTDEGPVPPVADKVTTYTLTFEVEAGANDVTNGVFTTTFPQYVTWLNLYKGDGTVEFNPVAKQMRWNVGSMTAKTSKQLEVQVSLLPSVTQVGTTPGIVGIQEFRATDRFTNSSLNTTADALTTELSGEAGFDKDNGEIQKQE